MPQKQHIIPDTLTFTYVHNIPGAHSSAAFTPKTSEVFKEERHITPIIIERDKTMSASQMFNTEVCYGSELAYDAELATPFQALLIIPATLEEISTGYLYFAIPLSHTAKQEALATNTEGHPMQQRLRPLRHGWRWCLF